MSGTLSSPPLFDLLESKLGWVDARQRVLAQNIANIDTPAYVAKDVAPFSDALREFTIEPTRTNPLHLAALHEAGEAGACAARRTRARWQRRGPRRSTH